MATKSRSFLKFILITGIAVVINLLFTFLGAPFLRVIRNVFGAKKFWISGIFITLLLLALEPGSILIASLLISQWVTVGIYQELEERGKAGVLSAFISVIMGTAIFIALPALGSHFFELNLTENLKKIFEDSVSQMTGGKNLADYGLKMEFIYGLVPGVLAALQIINLAFALMFDRRTAGFLNLKFENVVSRIKLLEFRLPNFFIWISMISFLFSFIEMAPIEVKIVSLNVFIVLMTAYMFQGLAILEYLFLALRLGAFTKALIYLLIIGQLFFLLSFVGLIDFWADFRLRIRRWSLSKNKENKEI